jgi:NADH-quinone oxidoreductase subunit C
MAYSNEEVLQFIREQLGSEPVSATEPHDFLTVEVLPSQLISLVGALKAHPQFQFTFMTDLCGLHLPEQIGKELGVVYMFHSWTNNIKIRLKVFVPVENPLVPSMTAHFNSANWMERETYDFYGILFENHPDLRRILNVDDMDYFPMRKEYPLEDQLRHDKVDAMFGR